MEKPLISVIIPVFNRANLVKEAIESVLDQTSDNWELIVVDDGSTDNTWEVLKVYEGKDKRIKVFKRNREPKGAPTCRNIGLNKVSSDLVMFLDSDDLLAPWAIENRLSFAKFNDFDILVFNGMEFDNKNLYNRFERANFRIKDPLKYFVNYQAAWGTANSLWKKSFLLRIGGWYEHALTNQDPVLHLISLSKGAKIVFGNEVPDVFIRVEKGFEKISYHWSLEKTESALKTLEYVKSHLASLDFEIYKNYFFSDLINKLELLDNNSLRELNNNRFRLFEKIPKNKGLRFYFTLYANLKNIFILRGLIYRLRCYITEWPRIENIRERTRIKEGVFLELLHVAKPYNSFKKKVKVLQEQSFE